MNNWTIVQVCGLDGPNSLLDIFSFHLDSWTTLIWSEFYYHCYIWVTNIRKKAYLITNFQSQIRLFALSLNKESHSDFTPEKQLHAYTWLLSILSGYSLVMTEKRIQKVHCKFVQNVCIYKYVSMGVYKF